MKVDAAASSVRSITVMCQEEGSQPCFIPSSDLISRHVGSNPGEAQTLTAQQKSDQRLD